MFQKPRQLTFAEILYKDIYDDEYLKQIYSNLMYNYLEITFNDNPVLKDININDALHFADFLSKAKNIYHYEDYVRYGQQIAVLLFNIYKNDVKIKYFLGSILSNLSNYIGLESDALNDYETIDPLDAIFFNCEKEQLKIPGSNDKTFLYDQKRAYDLLQKYHFSYSGPTSMGKSFIIQVYIKEEIVNNMKKNYAIIVPTKALINETTHSMYTELGSELINKNYRIVNGVGDIVLQQEHNFIFILTPERLLHILLAKKNIDLDFVFVDEAQKISEKGDRSIYYYDVIDKVVKQNPNCRVSFASPNIPNPDIYLNLVPNLNKNNLNVLASNYSPVNQFKFLINTLENNISIYNDFDKTYIAYKNKVKVSNIKDLIKIVGSKKQNVVYCSAKHSAIDEAIKYAEDLPYLNNDKLIKLSNDIKNNLHNDCYLTKLILKGVAYHVSYLPHYIKKNIEEAFKNKDINIIFSTSTLMEGVNLPADNLYIMNYRNGPSNLDEVSFKNLVGRVGRIKYNLYGNVFLMVLKEETKIEKYNELLTNAVPYQKLSTKIDAHREYFETVVSDLVKGDIELNSIKNNEKVTNREYNTLRKFAITLVRDLSKDRNTTIRREFDDYLDENKIVIIKEKYPLDKISEDISLSIDQSEKLKEAIANGMEYPLISNDDNDYEEIVKFLYKMNEIFKWDLYEKKDTESLMKSIRWYALILLWWMKGYGMGQIIKNSINHKRNTSGSKIMNPQNRSFVTFNNSVMHINWVIAETLEMIDKVILFTLSNYFRKFSLEYKEFHQIEILDNDWYDFVEYGTMNPLTILLQRYGFTRESSKYLEEPGNKEKYVFDDGIEIKIYDDIFECEDEMVKMNAKDVNLNSPELFIKKEK